MKATNSIWINTLRPPNRHRFRGMQIPSNYVPVICLWQMTLHHRGFFRVRNLWHLRIGRNYETEEVFAIRRTSMRRFDYNMRFQIEVWNAFAFHPASWRRDLRVCNSYRSRFLRAFRFGYVEICHSNYWFQAIHFRVSRKKRLNENVVTAFFKTF